MATLELANEAASAKFLSEKGCKTDRKHLREKEACVEAA
jgi:hypothetical protein